MACTVLLYPGTINRRLLSLYPISLNYIITIIFCMFMRESCVISRSRYVPDCFDRGKLS